MSAPFDAVEAFLTEAILWPQAKSSENYGPALHFRMALYAVRLPL